MTLYIHIFASTILFMLNTEAKVDGSAFLSLDKGSLEQFGLSTEFQTQLMKIFEEIVCHQCQFFLGHI